MNIKVSLLHSLAAIGLAASLVALPIDATAAAITFALVGILAVLFADYGRNLEPLRVPAEVIPLDRPAGAAPDLRAAA